MARLGELATRGGPLGEVAMRAGQHGPSGCCVLQALHGRNEPRFWGPARALLAVRQVYSKASERARRGVQVRSLRARVPNVLAQAGETEPFPDASASPLVPILASARPGPKRGERVPG